MSIEAINEQLLRAIGVGVALVEFETGTLQFANDTFVRWFGRPDKKTRLAELMPGLDVEAVLAQLPSEKKLSAEVSFKLGRRPMTVAIEFNHTPAPERLAVLVCQNISRIKELEAMIDAYSMMVERNTHDLKREKEQVEKLLLNMMPRSAYQEYKSFGVVAPRIFDSVSALILDFTNIWNNLTESNPAVVVSELNDIYTAFDRIGEQFDCGRVRTTGDSYLVVSGVPDPAHDHATSIASTAIRFLRYLEQRNATHPYRWSARIGLASGPAIGSVIGAQKYIYDVFGPAVGKADAARLKAQPMQIEMDPSFSGLIDQPFAVAEGRLLEAKNHAPAAL